MRPSLINYRPCDELKVASGAAGSVWKARYRGHIVAAKQLRAMSDLVGLDDVLVELVNEVRLQIMVLRCWSVIGVVAELLVTCLLSVNYAGGNPWTARPSQRS